MTERSSSLAPALSILALLLALSGCYTILNHPPIETSYEAQEYTSCYDCHDVSMYSGYYSPMAYPDLWSDYYAVPWWHNDIYIYDSDSYDVPTRSIITDRVIRTRDDDIDGSRLQRRSIAPMIRRGTADTDESDSSSEERRTKSNSAVEKKGSTRRESKARTRNSDREKKDRDKDNGRDRS